MSPKNTYTDNFLSVTRRMSISNINTVQSEQKKKSLKIKLTGIVLGHCLYWEPSIEQHVPLRMPAGIS